MNNIEKYNYLRDSLALGIARMAEICEKNKASDNNFKDAFEYTLMQLKNFDKYWEDLLSSAFTFFK